MKTIFDLPEDLVENEIISNVPMTSLRSVRSTCKKWNTLCKNRIFSGEGAAAAAKKQFMGFVMMDLKIYIMNFNLGKDGDLVDPSIKRVSVFDQIQMFNMFHCDGLLLCVLKDSSRLVVWNPNLGQTRWIKPRKKFCCEDTFALGYDTNLNHKILRIFDHPIKRIGFELYCFSSCSWKVLDVTQDWLILSRVRGVSLKRNAYFPTSVSGFFVCFDFTTESFGPLLPLPFQSYYHEGVSTSLSSVREDQLTVLYQHWEPTIEISVTDKIGPDVVSWTKFLKVVNGFSLHNFYGSFFIDEEKKTAVVFLLERAKACWYRTAHVIGQDVHFKSVRIREAPDIWKSWYPRQRYCAPLVCSSYLPSLVQL